MIPYATPQSVAEALALLRENLTPEEKKTIAETGCVFAYITLLNCFHLNGPDLAVVHDIERRGIQRYGIIPGEWAAGILIDMFNGKTDAEINIANIDFALRYKLLSIYG
jgi:hypothetical protein